MNRREFILSASVATVSSHVYIRSFAKNGSGYPRVLIIGDSISIGYTPFVKEMLKGEAEVYHNPGNAEHTGTGLEKIHDWLGDETWDVIHFNWGLWDLCYRHPDSKVYGNRDKVNGDLTHTIKEYRSNLRALLKILILHGRCLIWANTTPVSAGEAGRFEGDAARYNRAALKIMKKQGIRINDLHGFMLPHMQKYQVEHGDVHFTPAGYRYLAEKVAEEIGACLTTLGS